MNRLLVLLFSAAAISMALATEPTATKPTKPGIYFVKYLGSLERYLPIKTASLGDKHFGVLFIQEPVKAGKHILTLTVYDGAANEVAKEDEVVEPKDSKVVFASTHHFDPNKVAIGTWTWVAELDGRPLFTETIYVGI